jgi:hypothetical protein
VTCGGGGGGAEDDHIHTLTVNDKQYTLKIRDISGDLALYSEFYPNVLHSPLCVWERLVQRWWFAKPWPYP